MISPSELEQIRCAFENPDIDFNEFLNRKEEYTSREFICDITWTREDIVNIRPDYTDEQLDEAMHEVAGTLEDRSTEEGWSILEDIVWSKEQG